MHSIRKQWLPTLAAFYALFINPCHADIYAFVDDHGVRHVTNVPNDPRYRLVMRTPVMRPTYRKLPTASSKNYTSYSPSRQAGKPFGIDHTNRQRFAQDIAHIASKYQLEAALIHAIISAESAFNPTAVSSAGAMGLMQLMPATAERFGVHDPFDPVANIQGGARYLRFLLDEFQNLNLALAAYNAGEGAVMRYGNTIPPYEETQTYVSRVLRFYDHYRRFTDGS